MSEYETKLSALVKKKQRLVEEEEKLIQKRKTDIGNLAERLVVLIATDEIIAGLFTELATALNDKSPRLKEWEIAGARFLKSRKISATALTTASATKKASTTVPAHANA